MANVSQDRSPLGHAESGRTPIILLQSMEDPVVPPAQAEFLVRVLRRKGLPFAYVPFERERHGVPQSASIRRALEVELYFDSSLFGFELADRVEPVPIENLKRSALFRSAFLLSSGGRPLPSHQRKISFGVSAIRIGGATLVTELDSLEPASGGRVLSPVRIWERY